ncbi:MAG TPA: sigma-70 family RNA polymerase sigma factor [Steroidobacteraceae bacterium]|nr:sigma-70 family RNA polymerase sigma factor [Steroidobacteraceae bacterium]
MSEGASQPVTVLIGRWKAGDESALKALLPLVYDELRRLAAHYLRGERSGHTLQSTALVNEAYLRLVGQKPGDISSRAHFIGVAAHLMREVLVDHARAHSAAKRDGGARVELRTEDHPLASQDVDVMALDEAMTHLAKFDPDLCRIVELRFFGGLSVEDSATVMGISPATVKREWAAARAWLSRQLGQDT